MTNAFGAPKPPAEDGDIVNLDDLHDRLVLIQCKKVETKSSTKKNDDGTDKPDYRQITADIVVLDGRNVIGKERVELPKLFKDVWITGSKIVGQLDEYVGNSDVPYALGRFGKGEKNKFGFSPRILEPYDEEDAKLAGEYLASQTPAL
jgi:rRNA processing protein Gar1